MHVSTLLPLTITYGSLATSVILMAKTGLPNMSESSQFSPTLFLPIWFIFAGFILYSLILWAKLVNLLAKRFPAYYQKVGRPTAFYSDSLLQQFRTQNYMFKILFKKLPSDIPQDKEVLKLIRRLRKVQRIVLIPFVILIVLSIYGILQGY